MATAFAKIAGNNFESKEFKQSIEFLQKAHKLDPDDHLVCYDLALQYAQKREVSTHFQKTIILNAKTFKIQKAMKLVKQSLLSNRAFPSSWALLCLLLTAQQEHEDALEMIAYGIEECADDLT